MDVPGAEKSAHESKEKEKKMENAETMTARTVHDRIFCSRCCGVSVFSGHLYRFV